MRRCRVGRARRIVIPSPRMATRAPIFSVTGPSGRAGQSVERETSEGLSELMGGPPFRGILALDSPEEGLRDGRHACNIGEALPLLIAQRLAHAESPLDAIAFALCLEEAELEIEVA